MTAAASRIAGPAAVHPGPAAPRPAGFKQGASADVTESGYTLAAKKLISLRNRVTVTGAPTRK
jgi:hypothetical protein